MNVLIFEDENHTAKHLSRLLKKVDDSINIIATLSSVKEGVKWLTENDKADLIFQDIILNDGNCFDLFKQIDLVTPIIFTTAFSEYAIQSFKVNSIDYIVKPYDIEDIKSAIQKLHRFKGAFYPPEKKLLENIANKGDFTPKQRFLIKTGDAFIYINSKDVAFLFSEDSVTFAMLFNQKKYIIDNSIVELSTLMDSSTFFQINRKLIVNIESVQKIHVWFNGRLKIELDPNLVDDIIVSRERVKDFKTWLNQ